MSGNLAQAGSSPPGSFPDQPKPQPCHTCGTTSSRRYTCIQCSSLAFCDDCWPKWVLHAPGMTGLGGKPHEKSDPEVVRRLQRILEPARSEADHAEELLEDEETTWFGFGRDPTGQPVFQDYGRFASILGESSPAEGNQRFPQLISFIGETGAGKSTLIKLLIERQDAAYSGEGSSSCRYYSPVSSSENDRLPTTGDVHLYADPSSFHGESPLLFIDCEGLNGGEALPKGLRHHLQEKGAGALDRFAQFNSGSGNPQSPTAGGDGGDGGEGPGGNPDVDRAWRSRHSSARSISWATKPETRKREYAVAQLYPRILYTFSDAVVFVLRNPRSFESRVLGRLLRWGASSVDKSLNQPVLPHAILVLNTTGDGINESEWEPENATKLLMADIRDAVHREPSLGEYVRAWQSRGREIRTTEELLACYYASVTVVRVPVATAYMRLDAQLGKLDAVLRGVCAQSHARKRQARMLAGADRLQVYLQAAYDHFTRDLDAPFDFVREALRHSPPPRNFEGNILSLAVQIRDHAESAVLKDDARHIFQRLGPFVASCIMLDFVRQNLLGTAARLFNDVYAEPCSAALQTFADMHWPCSYRHPTMPVDSGRCVNVKSGHSPKGHQNAQGKIIGQGGYQRPAAFEAGATLTSMSAASLSSTTSQGSEQSDGAGGFSSEWRELVRTSLRQLLNSVYELGQRLPGRTDLHVASVLHRERVNDFFRIVGNVPQFVSHSACFCCLRGLPECALPCGHVLCLPCVKTYGIVTSQTTLELTRCPLHVREIMANPPWKINIKPKHAGTRILSIDGGGGVRGIVQLQTLLAIEKVLGPGLPIQLFFDLIVGTSTGGIIAVALGVKRWSVSLTIKKYKSLAKEFYVQREMVNLPLFGSFSSLYHGSIYKTRPMEKALKISFPDQPFFGGGHSHVMPIKVAVTAATAVEKSPVVFANYNRPDPSDWNLPYRFVRPDIPSKEMSVWEAVRSTCASPPFWKIYTKPETNIQYSDGGVHYRNPTEVAYHESRLVWSDASERSPDILLSIGAGRSVRDAMEDAQQQPQKHSRPQTSSGRSFRSSHRTPSQVPPTESDTVEGPSSTQQAETPLAPQASRRTKPSVFATLPGLSKLENYRKGDTDWKDFIARLKSDDLKQAPSPTNSTQKSSSSAEDDQGFDIMADRYVRLCPELRVSSSASGVPPFNDLSALDVMERETDETLQEPEAAARVREVAHRLVASCFYFDKEPGSVKKMSDSTATITTHRIGGEGEEKGTATETAGGIKGTGYTCQGSIYCLFRNSSAELKALGEFLKSCFRGSFEPYFSIEEEVEDTGDDDKPGPTSSSNLLSPTSTFSNPNLHRSSTSSTQDRHRQSSSANSTMASSTGSRAIATKTHTRRVALTEAMIQDMCWHGYWELPDNPLPMVAAREHSVTRISLCLQAGGYTSEAEVPISGFPRKLISEDWVAKNNNVPSPSTDHGRSSLQSDTRFSIASEFRPQTSSSSSPLIAKRDSVLQEPETPVVKPGAERFSSSSPPPPPPKDEEQPRQAVDNDFSASITCRPQGDSNPTTHNTITSNTNDAGIQFGSGALSDNNAYHDKNGNIALRVETDKQVEWQLPELEGDSPSQNEKVDEKEHNNNDNGNKTPSDEKPFVDPLGRLSLGPSLSIELPHI